MVTPNNDKGREELRAARRESRPYYWFVGVFSAFVNLLMLTGPLYMLQVYDRVLGSRSEATLVALSVLVIFLYGMMGLLDYVRGRIMGRVAARFQSRLDLRVFDAVVRRAATQPDELAATGLRDLESVQRLLASPVLLAIFDLPWTPFFLFGIMLFHPWLGYLAIAGGGAADHHHRHQPDRDPQPVAALQFGDPAIGKDLRPDPRRIGDGAGDGHARRCLPALAIGARRLAQGPDRVGRPAGQLLHR